MAIADSQEVISRGILGYRNYRSDKREFFKEDFDDVLVLQDFLNEISTGESDITGIGREYLLELFKDTVVLDSLVEIGGVAEEDGADTREGIIAFVNQRLPHEIAHFIAQARENSAKNEEEK